jgi:hypothetical protein
MTTYAFTSVNKAYIPKARVLAQSLKEHNPEIRFCLLFAEPRHIKIPAEIVEFDEVIYISDLSIENFAGWIFSHSVVELCTAIKGFFLDLILERDDCENVIYLDPDIIVLTPLDELIAEFKNASILLTPHLTEPEPHLEGITDNELCALQHGVYNLGFLGIRNDQEGKRFAQWWKSRLKHFCYADIPNGIFTDQRWVDLVPAFFSRVSILKDPGYNVATWNLNNRMVEGSYKNGFTVNGQPLKFYHFSGLDSGDQLLMLNKYGSNMPALFELRQWYLERCATLALDHNYGGNWFYDYFANGEKITEDHRKVYRSRSDLENAFVDPFQTDVLDESYFHWYEAAHKGEIGSEQGSVSIGSSEIDL